MAPALLQVEGVGYSAIGTFRHGGWQSEFIIALRLVQPRLQIVNREHHERRLNSTNLRGRRPYAYYVTPASRTLI
jgi:hypothetical protein